MTREEFYYPGSDGVHQIHAALWLPDGEARGVVQLVHGMCEYVLRYEPFARFLTGHGFAVVGGDHLGHGGSVAGPQEYGFFRDWRNLLWDVRALRARMDERFPGLPYFLLGHSMGSFVARSFLIVYPGAVTGCLLSGTAYLPPAVAAAAKGIAGLGDPHKVNRLYHHLSLGAYNRAFAPNRTAADWICRDERVVDAYLADPLCGFPAKGGMDRAIAELLQFVCRRRSLRRMDPSTPVRFFAGDRDPVGGMGKGVEKTARLFRQVGCRDVTLKLYPGARHETLNETNRRKVRADVLAWMEQYL